MEVDCLPFKTTGYFSNIICDYLNQDETLKPFYNRFPVLENFKEQIEEKQSSFSSDSRIVLSTALEKQYEGIAASKKTKANIEVLKKDNSFTVVTGHQLNLFTGPLYFLYKIIATINLTSELKKAYPAYNFVPIYWMATEDHDFEEINYFNFKGKKLQWIPTKEQGGAVGPYKTDGLQNVFDALSNVIGSNKNAGALKELFTKAYIEHDNLTDATRYLANALFGEYGLVIVDGDDRELKKQLVPFVEKDIDGVSFEKVTETISKLQKLPNNYGIQVNPREINYFYLVDGVRERIIQNDELFVVNNTEISWNKSELLKEINDFPERFSPNVIARPLYQEVILPNLCYIGGGGELAYWLELKSAFETMNVPFPMLLLRNSALIMTEKQAEKAKKVGLSTSDLFLKQNTLINKKIREISNINIDFSSQRELLEEQFTLMYDLASKTDKSFLGAVKAQEKKQLKGLNALEKRLLQAQKRKLKDHVVRLTDIQNQLFPNHSLQERQLNFSELYLEYGDALIPNIMAVLKPLSGEFNILKMS